MTAADARVNKSSASYAQGVTDADARVNTSSASYTAGRTQGQADTAAYNIVFYTFYDASTILLSTTNDMDMTKGIKIVLDASFQGKQLWITGNAKYASFGVTAMSKH